MEMHAQKHATLHAFIEEQAILHPDNIAVIYNNKSISYYDLNKKANQLAHYLQTQGVCLEDPVVLCIERSIELLISIVAIAKAGCVYLPIDAKQPQERLLFILKDNNNPLLLTTSKIKPTFHDYQGKIILWNDDVFTKQPSDPLQVSISPHNLAYIIYTSGSTGTPKGVLIEHKSIVHNAEWFAGFTSMQPQQRIDFSSSHIFDMAIANTLIPLMLGLTIVICPEKIKTCTRSYLEHIQIHKIEIIKITPSYFNVLVQEASYQKIPLPDLKTIILGGENLSAISCKKWLEIYPAHIIFNEYGPTETTVAMIRYRVSVDKVSQLTVNVPIGNPEPDMPCYILNEEQKIVPKGETGELYIGGIQLARGYLNQPEMTRKKFIINPFGKNKQDRLYKTGDLCRELPDGLIEYIGRIDSQIKVRGFRVEPLEIEQYLNKHEAIQRAIVIAEKDNYNENKILAYYIPKSTHIQDKTLNTQALQQFLKKHLPDYMIPLAFISVSNFPLTANGKLDYRALPPHNSISNRQYIAPRTKLEKEIAKIWSNELAITKIGVNDNFFELGGHSLIAARIISAINNSFKTNIRVYDFYSYPTITNLAKVIKNDAGSNESTYIATSIDKLSQLPLNDFQFMLWLANIFEPKANKINIISRKRILGVLNVDNLNYAIECLLKQYPILKSHILSTRPIQRFEAIKPWHVTKINLDDLSSKKRESKLSSEFTKLLHFNKWKKYKTNIIIHLYQWDNISELHIGLSHFIADNLCPELIFTALSKFYSDKTNQSLNADYSFATAITWEQQYLAANIDKDLNFWSSYLHDAKLFTFPQNVIFHNKSQDNYSYSSYINIPSQAILNLQKFCSTNKISIVDGVCAVLAQALYKCSMTEQNQSIVMNIIKSTRNDAQYENALGCFLHMDFIKTDLNKSKSLIEIAQQIHQSVIDTSPYQQCSDLIKLASINNIKNCGGTSTPTTKRSSSTADIDKCEKVLYINRIKQTFMRFCLSSYIKLANIPTFYYKILNHCLNMHKFKRNTDFLINVNINRDFFTNKAKNHENLLFGHQTQTLDVTKHDAISIDSVFEIYFGRDNKNEAYIIISANLLPKFREQIAKTMIDIIVQEVEIPQ